MSGRQSKSDFSEVKFEGVGAGARECAAPVGQDARHFHQHFVTFAERVARTVQQKCSEDVFYYSRYADALLKSFIIKHKFHIEFSYKNG